jgi:UDP-sulfoquinovose synthase
MKTVFILGGDGFIGWPTALKFAHNGYRTIIVDNLVRNPIHQFSYQRRKSHENIIFRDIDVAREPRALRDLFDQYSPNHVVHLAEQRSAPHSMLDRRHTVDNNICATHNLLDICAGTSTNIVHIGSMGVFGYSGSDDRFDPGSIYHMTKCMDSLMFDYYNKNWDTKITDLHQGIIWGWETYLTKTGNGRSNRFDYDGIYGTVLNRFLFQAANGEPLTVYGSGKRERAFIHLEDSIEQLYKSALSGKHETKKLFTEVLNLKELAEMIAVRYGASIKYVKNPRKELDENKLHMESDYVGDIKLNSEYLDEIVESLRGKSYNPEMICNSPVW